MKNKIIRTLETAIPELKLLNDDFYIIGAAAIILHGIEIGETYDIDILTSSKDSDQLKQAWNDKLVTTPKMKDSDLFHSNFAQYKFPEMDIEVQGDLQVLKNDEWLNLNVSNFTTLHINDLPVRIPTIDELIRILNLFGREKDLKRILILNQYLEK